MLYGSRKATYFERTWYVIIKAYYTENINYVVYYIGIYKLKIYLYLLSKFVIMYKKDKGGFL